MVVYTNSVGKNHEGVHPIFRDFKTLCIEDWDFVDRVV